LRDDPLGKSAHLRKLHLESIHDSDAIYHRCRGSGTGMTPRTPIPQLVESKGQHIGSSNDPEKTVAAPDGGYGWVCVACCFWINANTWGINSVSVTTRTLAKNLTKDRLLSRMVYFWLTTSQLPSIRARLIWNSPSLVVSLSRKRC